MMKVFEVNRDFLFGLSLQIFFRMCGEREVGGGGAEIGRHTAYNSKKKKKGFFFVFPLSQPSSAKQRQKSALTIFRLLFFFIFSQYINPATFLTLFYSFYIFHFTFLLLHTHTHYYNYNEHNSFISNITRY